MGFGAEVAVWWALLTGLWLITLSSVTTAEEIAAAGCALVSALAVAAARRAMEGAWRPVARWFSWAGPFVLGIPADTWRVLAFAASRLRHLGEPAHDELERVPVPVTEGSAVGNARRALGTFVVSATPGTVVVDWSEDGDELVVHRLVRGEPSLEERVVR